MFEVQATGEFEAWVKGLAGQGKARVLARISNMKAGNFGDHKSVGGGVWESRIDSGPGYRIYYTRRGNTVVVLLAGGDKGSQDRDIRRAKQLAEGDD